ncbi:MULTISPECIES: NAD-dependent epimerase/dehydratase family protein [unclassified Sphingomonas]|uniref:NAD-dependent epimerase/dehydratase family protein n=1 Tax=unclassified Sphingomonas TaxID=196159 RepID=UPI000829F3E0|nr:MULTISPECIES: NAD-dependent epimerase/dehydratase family protein [unclassified Sphingomonas]
MHVFITGASGFVGGAAARHLVAAGHRVSAMSRSAASDAKVVATGATPVRCDLGTIAPAHLAGVDAVVHAAAFVESWGPKNAWFKANVLGTQAVLDAARAASVARFVHIGTEAAIVRGQDVHDADEDVPLAPDSPYPYCATKAQAEARVRAANAPGFATIVLRPRLIWGPGDTTLLPTLTEMARAGSWVWVNGGRAVTSTTHIANLAHAIELALTRGTPGAAYFVLDDGTVTMREMFGGLAGSAGLTLPDKSIPRWLADLLGGASEGVWRAFGLRGEPPLTRHAAMVMSRDCTLDDARARRELGYMPVVDRAAGMAALRAG